MSCLKTLVMLCSPCLKLMNPYAFYTYCMYGISLNEVKESFLFSLFQKGTKTLFHMQILHRSCTVLNNAIDVQWNIKM